MASIASRPLVGIERLPSTIRRNIGPEQRESMNCKSCRKRKIKCNRLRPTCEACKVFQCPCLYDAIPKKRGPKTDVLEALVKRIDGLEKRLAEEKKPPVAASAAVSSSHSDKKHGPAMSASQIVDATPTNDQPSPHREMAATEQSKQSNAPFAPLVPKPAFRSESDIMIDAFFQKVHKKPFHILDEATIRQQCHTAELSQALRLAIYAVGSRYTNSNGDYATCVRISEQYAQQARLLVDVDEPSIEGLQALLLIHRAFFAAGKGRKSHMHLAMAIGMAIALDLHLEASTRVNSTSGERELRRSLFWTCYLMDRFTSCGSKRPALISDNSMVLRLPSWIPYPGAEPIEGEYFSVQANLQYMAGSSHFSQSSSVLLIDITRILGETNRYLANGGVKGDSHFPWHALSNLSKIRHALDTWASGNQDLFTDLTSLFAHPDCIVFVLSKMIYHVIHCLIYRPFLPIILAELGGTGQHQSWQIEATNLCFLHANAIAELSQVARHSPTMEWPAFAAYCVATAGTVHVHGAHYNSQEGEVFFQSTENLSQEMQILSDLRYQWACTQFQHDMLRRLYTVHTELVRSVSSNPLHFSSVFHLEDFFDRYPGHSFDGAHVSFTDVQYEATTPPPPSNPSVQHAQGQGLDNIPLNSTATHHIRNSFTPPITQISNPGRGYPDSAISLSTAESSDDKPTVTHRANLIQSIDSAELNRKGTFSPPYAFKDNSLATETVARYDPTLFSTPTPGPGVEGGIYGLSTTPHTSFATLVGTREAAGSNHQQHGEAQGDRSDEGDLVVSNASGSKNEDENDPFLKLLEQLAENEGTGGPGDFDFILGET